MENSFSKYFTPLKIANSLMSLLDFCDNSSVIDICCGSCNLLIAAKTKNPTIKCTGVDISECENKNDFTLQIEDGRDFALNNKGKYDVSLANPPFGKESNSVYSDNLYSGIYENINIKRIEVEMLIANLLILQEKGKLLIIIPSTIVYGSLYKKFRKIISKNHYVESIIDLPINAFYPERIKCSALIIQKKPNEKLSTKHYDMTVDFKLLKKESIKANLIQEGCWSGLREKKNKEYTIHQGKISSGCFTDNREFVKVLHTNKPSKNWKPSIRYAKIDENLNYIKAEKGDIIISRVGSSAGYKYVYNGKDIYISDCLFVIKQPSENIKRKIMELDLFSIIGGLSAPYITSQGIYNLYCSNNRNTYCEEL